MSSMIRAIKKIKQGQGLGVWGTLFCKGGLKSFLEEKPELLPFNCIWQLFTGHPKTKTGDKLYIIKEMQSKCNWFQGGIANILSGDSKNWYIWIRLWGRIFYWAMKKRKDDRSLGEQQNQKKESDFLCMEWKVRKEELPLRCCFEWNI